MTTRSELHDDLRFVSAAVSRHERGNDVPAIYVLWAVIVAAGYALPDFAPAWAGRYWMLAGPLGGVASWLLAMRHGMHRGVADVALGKRHGAHWITAGVAFVLIALSGWAGFIGVRQAAAQFVLVAALAYTYAGIHLNRPLLWSGGVLFLGYAALTLVSLPYTWTATGLLAGAALLIAAWHARRNG